MLDSRYICTRVIVAIKIDTNYWVLFFYNTGVIFFNTQQASLIHPRTGVEKLVTLTTVARNGGDDFSIIGLLILYRY